MALRSSWLLGVMVLGGMAGAGLVHCGTASFSVSADGGAEGGSGSGSASDGGSASGSGSAGCGSSGVLCIDASVADAGVGCNLAKDCPAKNELCCFAKPTDARGTCTAGLACPAGDLRACAAASDCGSLDVCCVGKGQTAGDCRTNANCNVTAAEPLCTPGGLACGTASSCETWNCPGANGGAPVAAAVCTSPSPSSYCKPPTCTTSAQCGTGLQCCQPPNTGTGTGGGTCVPTGQPCP